MGNDVLEIDRDGTLSHEAYRKPRDLGNITERAHLRTSLMAPPTET
ncbi:hypothetical protein I545_7016 [Mycobacterium kansasii 662]|uniref:Uncharacterized protein n=1 Tax=Mycobacterium kansasii 662 TaxID=1299326 RepID=X7XN78_MYCKA|nr:hypothetical protein I545_7016 [Mycobacterium kansasii 662]